MFDRLVAFFSSPAASQPKDGTEPREVRLAAAALLVHAMQVDGRADEAEYGAVRESLMARFGLSDEDHADLLRAAERAEAEAIDLYGFTSVITRHLDQDGRQRIIAMLWDVVLADGRVDDHEAHLVARVAELLGVSTRDRVRLRQEARGRLGLPADAQNP